jgi:hypothetical protein
MIDHSLHRKGGGHPLFSAALIKPAGSSSIGFLQTEILAFLLFLLVTHLAVQFANTLE